MIRKAPLTSYEVQCFAASTRCLDVLVRCAEHRGLASVMLFMRYLTVACFPCCLRAPFNVRPALTFTSPGNVKTISGQFRKADLCTEHRLNVSTSPPTLPPAPSPTVARTRERIADASPGSRVICARSIQGCPTSCPRSWCERKRSLYVSSLACSVAP